MIASFMWRRRRVARFEVAVISANMERTEEDLQVAQAYGAGTLSKGPLPSIPPQTVAQHQQRRILPAPEDLDKIMKYEAHFHRMQLQTQHELEALQARRKGDHSPLARVDFSGPHSHERLRARASHLKPSPASGRGSDRRVQGEGLRREGHYARIASAGTRMRLP